jgi:2-amino-4-hydroxy-6-hydroxymethyldihydropteridine diphosphokinase
VSAVAVVALGSNLGDRQATLESAIVALGALPESSIRAVSSWHGTTALTPHGPDPERPAYLNGVALLETGLDPFQLLDGLRAIENAHGRERTERWGDRTLDLDLIAFGDIEIDGEQLRVPHPHAHSREFVLAPWLEIQPDAELMGHGRVADLLENLRSLPPGAGPEAGQSEGA